MHKLDINRLNVLDRIRGRALGAARDGTDAQNDAVRARNNAQAEITKLNEQARMRPGIDYSEQIAAAEAELQRTEAQLEQAMATNEVAHERFNAAGNLAKACRDWATEKGLVRS